MTIVGIKTKSVTLSCIYFGLIVAASIVIGLFASIFKCISPDYNNGTNILFVLSFIISTSALYKEMDIKVNNKMCFVLVILMSIYYLVIFGMCKYIDDTRLSYIKEQKEAGLTTIEVKSNPFFLVYRYNPTEVFQKRDFKQFIEVPQDTKLEVKYFGVFKEIESRVKEWKREIIDIYLH